jgi:hypothetical protein
VPPEPPSGELLIPTQPKTVKLTRSKTTSRTILPAGAVFLIITYLLLQDEGTGS